MATSLSNLGAGHEESSLTNMLRDRFACGALSVDSEGNIVALTPLARHLLRLPGLQKKGSSSVTLPAPVQAIVEEARKTGQAVTDRQVVLQPNHPAPDVISITVMPVAPGSHAASAIVLLKDVSSTEKLDQHMRRLDRLASIGTLSASMAHEIKNALVPVRTFVSLLLEKKPDDELAGIVDREMARVDALVSRMLKFAAPAKRSFSPVRLHELLEHSLRLVQHRVEDKTIAFHRRFDAASDALSGDDYQLEQAFVNLLLNAVEAMGSEGSLTVSTKTVANEIGLSLRKHNPAPGQLHVTITDTGIGIAPEKMGSIFEPFFTTKAHGTGLGLAVTRRIIEEHEGAIRVESQPGKGTTFTVVLPASSRV
jgi:signal transduction histidine kinase